jgi:hypothetical protein
LELVALQKKTINYKHIVDTLPELLRPLLPPSVNILLKQQFADSKEGNA